MRMSGQHEVDTCRIFRVSRVRVMGKKYPTICVRDFT